MPYHKLLLFLKKFLARYGRFHFFRLIRQGKLGWANYAGLIKPLRPILVFSLSLSQAEQQGGLIFQSMIASNQLLIETNVQNKFSNYKILNFNFLLLPSSVQAPAKLG